MTIEAKVKNHWFSKTQIIVPEDRAIIGNAQVTDGSYIHVVRNFNLLGLSEESTYFKSGINKNKGIIMQFNPLTGRKVEFSWKP